MGWVKFYYSNSVLCIKVERNSSCACSRHCDHFSSPWSCSCPKSKGTTYDKLNSRLHLICLVHKCVFSLVWIYTSDVIFSLNRYWNVLFRSHNSESSCYWTCARTSWVPSCEFSFITVFFFWFFSFFIIWLKPKTSWLQ